MNACLLVGLASWLAVTGVCGDSESPPTRFFVSEAPFSSLPPLPPLLSLAVREQQLPFSSVSLQTVVEVCSTTTITMMNPNSNNPNRLNLNFGFNVANNRAYPTTPSAFPQPIYQSAGPQDYVSSQNGAYNQQGYFANGNIYAQQQAQYAAPHYGQNLQSPQPAYHLAYNNANDGTNGLIQQFSNQDLNSNRAMYGRTVSPATRPRTPGQPTSPQPYAGNQVPIAQPRARPQPEEELQRNPERFAENVHKRGRAAKELVNVFFQDNIERARDRNMR